MRSIAVGATFAAGLVLAGCSIGPALTEESPEPAELAQMVADCRETAAAYIGGEGEFDRSFDISEATVTGYQHPDTWNIEIPPIGGIGSVHCNWTDAVSTIDIH